MLARKNKKRTMTHKDRTKSRPVKRKLKQFSGTQFANTILGNLRFINHTLTERVANQVIRLCRIIEKYGERNDITDANYLKELIIGLLVNNRNSTININDFITRFQGYFNYDLQDAPAQYNEWLAILLNYLENNAHDDVLNHITDAYRQPEKDLFRDLFSTLTEQIESQRQNNFVYLPDFMAINRFLLDKQMVESYMDKLEDELQQFSRQNRRDQLVERADGKLTLPWLVTNLHKRDKILSTVLYDWARENGFDSNAKLLRAISSEVFASLLNTHTFFKDAAVLGGSYHGAWSHAMQWFFIIEHDKATGFLQHDPIELYENFRSAWDRVVDRLDENNYCSPEFITRTLCTLAADQRWPLLAGSVMRSHAKMYSPHFTYNAHLMSKHGEDMNDQGYITRPL